METTMPRRTFLVTLEQPEGASLGDLQDYIDDAVGTLCGSYQPPGTDDGPGHVMWGINQYPITVRHATYRRLAKMVNYVPAPGHKYPAPKGDDHA